VVIGQRDGLVKHTITTKNPGRHNVFVVKSRLRGVSSANEAAVCETDIFNEAFGAEIDDLAALIDD
jgi:hypothetical protein